MKIVVLDGYTENPGDLSWEGLERLGELTVYDRTPAELTVSRMGDAEIVYTNKTVISREVIEACPKLAFIGVLATGFNVVDVEAAKERSIPVTNIPGYGTDTVAQFTFGLILELCHHIGEHSDCVKAGEWTASRDFCFWKHPMMELSGKTLGVVGFGRIGQQVARIAEGFGMKVLANANHRRPELETPNCRYADLSEVISQSDVITLHCPLTPQSEGMMNRDSISHMKNGVLLI